MGKKVFVVLVKLAVTAAAFYYLSTQFILDDILKNLKNIEIGAFVVGVVLYLASQLLSAIRLNYYLKNIGTPLNLSYNFQLYLIGMAYNFFLPGGIGGDGYKVFMLRKRKTSTTKDLVSAMLVDRLIGLVAILVLLCILVTGIELPFVSIPRYLPFVLMPIGIVLSKYILKKIWLNFDSVFTPTLLMSIGVQALQAGTILTIFYGLGGNSNELLLTITFLFSTIVTAVPIFLGGLGARELVFSETASMDQFNVAQPELWLTVAVLFSITTLVAAIPGLYFNWKTNHPEAED